ncbi:MAG: hypothetical protein WKF72_07135 [Nocardioidaceae bacterium]
MSTTSRSLLLAVVATAVTVALGVTVLDEKPRPAPREPVAESASLADLDAVGLIVRRADFCGAIAPEPVAEALGAEPVSSSSYTNGQRARLTSRVADVAHEFSCTWEAEDGTTARAWVFAPPVPPGRARALADSAASARGCTVDRDSPAFGSPSVATVCSGGRQVQVAHRGLFGEAWLSCSVTAPTVGLDQEDLLDRTGSWCVSVVGAAAGIPPA